MEAGHSKSSKLIDALVLVEVGRLASLIDLSTRFVVDRVKQDPTSLGTDPSTGALLGALSDAALFAKAVIEKQIILKGGEPGHGL